MLVYAYLYILYVCTLLYQVSVHNAVKSQGLQMCMNLLHTSVICMKICWIYPLGNRTCSYEARYWGILSAITILHAHAECTYVVCLGISNKSVAVPMRLLEHYYVQNVVSTILQTYITWGNITGSLLKLWSLWLYCCCFTLFVGVPTHAYSKIMLRRLW